MCPASHRGASARSPRPIRGCRSTRSVRTRRPGAPWRAWWTGVGRRHERPSRPFGDRLGPAVGREVRVVGVRPQRLVGDAVVGVRRRARGVGRRRQHDPIDARRRRGAEHAERPSRAGTISASGSSGSSRPSGEATCSTKLASGDRVGPAVIGREIGDDAGVDRRGRSRWPPPPAHCPPWRRRGSSCARRSRGRSSSTMHHWPMNPVPPVTSTVSLMSASWRLISGRRGTKSRRSAVRP